MNKRALMLTAATVALLSGRAFADTSITTNQTTPQSTSTDGTITIQTTGAITISTNPPTAPALTLDGGTTAGTPADVLNLGTISYVNVGNSTTPVTGIQLETGNTGGFDNGTSGKVDMTGTGTNKTAFLISGPASDVNSGTFLGDLRATSGTTSPPCSSTSVTCIGGGTPLSQITEITDFNPANNAAILLETGSTVSIQGDASYGIDVVSGASLGNTSTPSDIDILGTLTMTPSSSSSTDSASSAIYIAGTMTGNINIGAGAVNLEGNSSFGINLAAPVESTGTPGGTLNGNVNIDGTLDLTPVSTTAVTAGAQNTAVYIAGTMTGDINIGTSGVVTSVGEGSQGVEVLGSFTGFIENQGELQTIGISSPSSAGGNPEAGSALLIGSSISGGIYNAGPLNSGDTTAIASIDTEGASSAVIFDSELPVTALVTTTASPLTVGLYQNDPGGLTNASFINRGDIRAAPQDLDQAPFATIEIEGTSGAATTFLGSFYNSGSITAQATDDTKVASVSATALDIGDYATVPTLVNSVLSGDNGGTSGSGTILAQAGGQEGGTAFAVFIHGTVGGGFGTLNEIDNSGSILATAATSNTELIDGAVQAVAIDDQSGTLRKIVNSGLIEATASHLSDNSQVAQAINLSVNTSGTDIEDSGTIQGDIVFGSGADTLDVVGGTQLAPASVNGTINFGGSLDSNPAADDILNIGAHGSVSGYVTEGAASKVDITVQTGGALNLLAAPVIGTNTNVVRGVSLNAGTLQIQNGGALGITVSQGFNVEVPGFGGNSIINAATSADIAEGAVVNLTYGSFLSSPNGAPATFALIATPGTFTLPGTELQQIINNTAIPYLFTGGVCTWDINGTTTCTTPNPIPGDQVLGLSLSPKTIGAQGCQTSVVVNGCKPDEIPLTGYAAKLFPYANIALGTDDALGGAIVSSVQDATEAEAAYENFAPDVSGASRALAISLTDDATNVVAARQRVLREYANQEGDTTLWGQQFVQRLNQQGTPDSGAGYTDTGFGFVLGMDDGDAIDGRYGGAFTFFSGDDREKLPRTSKTTSEWYMLTGYTDWRGKGLFLDTQLNVGYANFMGSRSLVLTFPDGVTYSRTAQNTHPGEFLAGGATTGVIYNLDNTVFTPQISLDGLAMREEGYSETGGGNGFDLKVASSYLNSLRAFTGLDVRQDFNFGDFLMQPDVRAGFRYDFANGAESLHTSFESVEATPGSVFDVTGPKPDKGNVVAGGGLAVSTGAWSIGVGFDYLRAGSGNTSEEGTLTLLGRI